MFRISRCLFRTGLAIGLSWVAIGEGGSSRSARAADPAPAVPASAPAAKPAPAGELKVRNVDVAKARALLEKEKDVVVIDVRTPAEFAGGHLADARNVDFNAKDFDTTLSGLDRGKTYLVHCAAGGRSTRSLETFRRLGFKSVVHMDGGLNAWTKAGYPVTK